MDIVVASKNRKKLAELVDLVEDLARVHLASELNPDVNWVESGDSFQANALIKAKSVRRFTDHWILADDSGLCVEALGGEPGIFSARYAGPDASDEDNNMKLLSELERFRDPDQRRAWFQCCLCLLPPQGEPIFFQGRCTGKIAGDSLGGGGFGYDPLFILDVPDSPHHGRRMAELSQKEKQRVSHRGQAMQQLALWLRKNSGH